MNLSRLEKSSIGWYQQELTSVVPIILVCVYMLHVCGCVCTCDVPGQGGCW